MDPLSSIRAACTLAAALAGAGASAQATAPLGVPSYNASALLDVQRGNNFPSVTSAVATQGFSGLGQHTAVAGPIPLPFYEMRPSDAYAAASATQLKATAVASGTVYYYDNAEPYVHASARAQTTTFWSFGSAWTMEFTPFLDGALSGIVGYWEVPGANNLSRVRFGLDLLDASGATLSTVFEVQANIALGNSADPLRFNASAAGFASSASWDAALTKTSDDHTSYSGKLAYDIGYAETITTPLTAQIGDIYGFRWFLETESWIQGYSVNAVFAADLGHTATIGFALSEAELAQRGIVELPSLPLPVPELPTLPLALAGMAMLALVRVAAAARGRGRHCVGAQLR